MILDSSRKMLCSIDRLAAGGLRGTELCSSLETWKQAKGFKPYGETLIADKHTGVKIETNRNFPFGHMNHSMTLTSAQF